MIVPGSFALTFFVILYVKSSAASIFSALTDKSSIKIIGSSLLSSAEEMDKLKVARIIVRNFILSPYFISRRIACNRLETYFFTLFYSLKLLLKNAQA